MTDTHGLCLCLRSRSKAAGVVGGKWTGVRPACRRSRLSVASNKSWEIAPAAGQGWSLYCNTFDRQVADTCSLDAVGFWSPLFSVRLGMSKVLHVTHFPKPQAVRTVKCQELPQRIPLRIKYRKSRGLKVLHSSKLLVLSHNFLLSNLVAELRIHPCS